MSFGKMRTLIDLVATESVKDEDGFSTKFDKIIASVKAYREGRHGNEKWANRATFSEATDLFRFRRLPGIAITTDMLIVCGGGRFAITSVENVKGRGMYLEVLAKEVKPSG